MQLTDNNIKIVRKALVKVYEFEKKDDSINFSSWNVFLYEHYSLNHDIVIKNLNIDKNIISNNEIISMLVTTENISNNQYNDIEIS